MIELRDIRYLVALGEEQSFSRAARRLHMAQPGLSYHIGELERRIGAQLVDRTTRPVRLTPAGQALVKEGQRLLVSLDEAIEFTRRVAQGEVGRIRMGSVASATFEVLPRFLRAYRARFPDVQLLLREMTTPGQIEAIRAGEIDVGIVRLPYDTGELATYRILEEGLGLVLPQSSPSSSSRRAASRPGRAASSPASAARTASSRASSRRRSTPRPPSASS